MPLKIGRLTSQLLYADRTHFIYELLQNAEDALARRGRAWSGKREVAFNLMSDQLRVEHYGDPFTEEDVKAICEFDESTKRESLTDIGRFGIGFKSVYAYTSEPQISSGDEHFAIRDYIFPYSNHPIEGLDPDQTAFAISFNSGSSSEYDEIAHGLASLHRRTLLFLMNLEEISWQTDQDRSGQYLRETKLIDDGVHRSTLVSRDTNDRDVSEEEWVVFSRTVSKEDEFAGEVQIAFLVGDNGKSVKRSNDCTLFARFATGMETHTGFLMNGPYQTTLSRDDVPSRTSWNRYLVEETASLLIESLQYFRDGESLNADVLRCLPLLDLSSPPARSLLGPLFERTRQALNSENFLPAHNGTYVSAQVALVPQTADLRELISSTQLSRLYGRDVVWLDGSVTSDSRLLNYVRNSLNIREVRPEEMIRRLSVGFLEDQTDEWIQDLYRFLQPQRALHGELRGIPIARLSDGSHVKPNTEGRGRVYLPSDEDTSFRTMHRRVCEDEIARGLLESLGIRKWDRIDDLVENVLPRYRASDGCPSMFEYSEDLRRIVRVWNSSNDSMRHRLEQELNGIAWVWAVDAGDPSHGEWCQPKDVYLAADELVTLFGGVEGFRIVDQSYECLVGTEIENLMKRCGAADGLRPIKVSYPDRFTEKELAQMRRRAYPSLQFHDAWDYDLIDWQLEGLETLLAAIRNGNAADARDRSELLWSLLIDMESGYFKGRYEWQYHKWRRCFFDSDFLLTLRNTAWIPDARGLCCSPGDLVFEELDWRHDDDLISELKFKSPVLEELANEAGLEIDLVQFLKSRIDDGMTAEEIMRNLGGTRGGSLTARKREDAKELEQGFAAALSERLVGKASSSVVSAPVRLPVEGHSTKESAALDKNRAVGTHNREGWEPREVSHKERGPEGKALADEFGDMVEGEYGQRCQICGSTFAKSDGRRQVFVVHVVRPTQHTATNYFGNLVGLCGWHFSIIQHGEWCLMSLGHRERVQHEEDIRTLVQNLPVSMDDMGNPYRGLPIRFWNVFSEWNSEASFEDTILRYSDPHWLYLCELLKDDPMESS